MDCDLDGFDLMVCFMTFLNRSILVLGLLCLLLHSICCDFGSNPIVKSVQISQSKLLQTFAFLCATLIEPNNVFPIQKKNIYS